MYINKGICFCIFLILFFIYQIISSAQIGYQQKGLASYYHEKFHGRRTSSGERFNQNKMTAAHRKLLFNTIVRVTNLSNDKSVIVRINDRGPYKYKGRIIDLTRVAAGKLGMITSGTTQVKIEVIGEDGKLNQQSTNNTHTLPGSFEIGKAYSFRGEERNPRGYGIQVASFVELVNAKYYAKELYREGFREIVIKVASYKPDSALFKVIVGEFKTKQQSLELIPKLKRKDFTGFPVMYEK